MNRAGRYLIGAFLLVCFVTDALAQNTPVSFHTVPAQPVAGHPFSIVATFVGGTPANAFGYDSTSDDGMGFKEIVINGVPDFPYQLGTETVAIPAQRAGTYGVSFTTFRFSPRPEYALFQITVADAGPVALSIGSTIVMISLIALIVSLSMRQTYGERSSRNG